MISFFVFFFGHRRIGRGWGFVGSISKKIFPSKLFLRLTSLVTWRHNQAMQHYLRSTKDVLRTLDCNKTELDVVLGNEACDLDSAVAAIVYGFFLQSKRGVSESN